MAGVVVLAAATGCGGPLTVSAPEPTGAAATACADLRAAAPSTVAGAPVTEVLSDGVVLAWGDPAIVLRCGVTAAEGMTRASRCDEVDGVGWYSEDLGDAYRFTTIGRVTPVEVTVPDEYAPHADALVDLAPAVRSVPLRRPCG